MKRPTLSPDLLGHLTCAAASGLALEGDALHVVADDCTRLYTYDRATLSQRSATALLPDLLPDEHRARKAAKPDLEMLTWLSPGLLLALGSGSKARRRRGIAARMVGGAPAELSVLNLVPLYTALEQRLPDLNLEGATVIGDALWLFQRGNGSDGQNAVIALDLAGVGRAIESGRELCEGLIRWIVPVNLGALGGLPLGFTDAAALPDGKVLFTAVAEAGGSTYEDGAFGGAVLGLLSEECEVLWLAPVAGDCKLEGLAVEKRDDGGVDVFLVADADDPTVLAPLLHLTLEANQPR